MNLAAEREFGVDRQRGFWLRSFWGLVIASFSLALSIKGWSQTVEVPCKGTAAECADRFNEFCKTAEDTAPNLLVPIRTRVWGVLIDPTGAVFSHPEPGLTIELRDPKTSQVLVSDPISEMGTFNLGTVTPGSYRLIVVLNIKGKRTRYRGWKQPSGLACAGGDECTIAALLRPRGTGNPINFCPPE